VSHGIVFQASQTLQRKRLRRGEIADAMLVMDRERLVGFARCARGARGDLEQTPRAVSRFVVLTRAAQQGREHPQRVYS